MKHMLAKVGWKKDFVENCVPIIPISGWVGDNLIKKSDKMPWWKGADVKVGTAPKKGKPDERKTIHIDTLYDCLDNMVTLPPRESNKPLRMPVSGVYKIKGVGDVITGCVEQGEVKKDLEVTFLPTHTSSKSCQGKIFSVEMHHKHVASANPGDNVGLNVKGLDKLNMPRVGDVMIAKTDTGLQACGKFTAQIQCLDHPGELKPGYSPIAFIRTGRSAVKIEAIKWKIGKATGGQKVENPPFIKANEMAEIEFAPQQPFVAEGFKQCEGLGRVAIMEGNTVVMLGKVVKVEFKKEK